MGPAKAWDVHPGGATEPPTTASTAEKKAWRLAVRQRRIDSIVSAAMVLAAEGYDAVQLRGVADLAGVATSTTYQYFSSKDDLLMACFRRWIAEVEAAIGSTVCQSNDPFDRLQCSIYLMTDKMCESSGFADSVIRAYAVPDHAAANRTEQVRDALGALFAGAGPGDAAPERRRGIGSLVTDVWTTNLLAVVQNRATVEEVRRRLTLTVSILRRQGTAANAIT